MKFLCITEFMHSGVRLHTSGTVYDISPEAAEQLIALDKKKELGALSFFSPAGEEAANFIKGKKASLPDPAGAGTPAPAAPKEPAKAELIQEAKALGIKATNFMGIEQLKEAIEAAKKAVQPGMGQGSQTTDQVQ